MEGSKSEKKRAKVRDNFILCEQYSGRHFCGCDLEEVRGFRKGGRRSLEESFGKLNIGNNILSVNVARFNRIGDAAQGMNINKKLATTNPHPPPSSAWNTVGIRSYANVLSSSHAPNEKKVSRIHLNPCSEIDSALFNVFLFGETLDIEILRKMPYNLKEASIKFGKVFLYGGLTTLIGFDEAEDARKILEDNATWSKWFKWIKRGDSILNWKFERSVALKIVGLPMQFRSPENLSKLLSQHGRILDWGDENIWKFEDLSFVNFSVGFFEEDYYVDPFDSIEDDKVEVDSIYDESSSEEDSCDEEELDSTEEGEIRSKCDDDDVVVAESPMKISVEKSQSSPVNENGGIEVGESPVDAHAVYGFNEQGVDNNFVFNATVTRGMEFSRVEKVNNVNGFTPGLLESGCFGPFANGPVNINGRKLPKSLEPISAINVVDPDLITSENINKKCRIEVNSIIDLNLNHALPVSSPDSANVDGIEVASRATHPVSDQAPITDSRVDELQKNCGNWKNVGCGN
ncbi:hypothetical protein L2E82_49077 [Cichorium intybus]|uniref:Uncharacterized protein n=1 Tax=Cichorium intybus TaxID=13427 RepID=A0ACB8Z3Q2_CICIN|nr:hypothetical protein L2E82_49077 [Cichorium intybus]